MKTHKLVVGVVLLSSAAAWAEAEYSANVSGGYRVTRNERESARFMEYRDLGDGVLSGLDFNYFNGAYHTDGFARNVGREDQTYRLNGGQYFGFRYSLWYDRMPHNLSFGAKSFYSGIGTDVLNYGAPNKAGNIAAPGGTTTFPTGYFAIPTDTNLWTAFDYTLKRTNLGGSFDLNLLAPYFASVTVSRVNMSGTRPGATASGVYPSFVGGSSGFNIIEFPEPVQQSTTDLTVEAGYKTSELYLSATGSLNKYDNDFDYLTFQNPYVSYRATAADPNSTALEKYSLAPDSKSTKIALQGTVYHLPLTSTLQIKASNEKITNTINLLNQILVMTSLNPANNQVQATTEYPLKTIGLDNPVFDGDLLYRTASVVWSAHPMEGLDSEVFYRYLNKKNSSTEVTYSNTPVAGESGYVAATPTKLYSVQNERLSYHKNNAGVTFGYKLPAKTKVKAGYEYLGVEREERPDTAGSRDHSVFIEAKNSFFDMVTGKIRYGYLRRTSDFLEGEIPNFLDPTNTKNLATRYNRLFDVTDKKQYTLKASLTVMPIESLDITGGYAYKKNIYDKTLLGLIDDRGIEWNIDIGYDFRGLFRVGFFGDIENVRRHGYHRVFVNNGDPTTTPTSEYNWEDLWKDKNYRYGVSLEVPVLANKLIFDTSYAQEKADGGVDIETQAGANPALTPVDIPNFGDYFKRSLHARFRYNVTENLGAAVGALWERLESDDFQYNAYQLVSEQSKYLFTGAYKDNAYSATSVYAMVSYRF